MGQFALRGISDDDVLATPAAHWRRPHAGQPLSHAPHHRAASHTCVPRCAPDPCQLVCAAQHHLEPNRPSSASRRLCAGRVRRNRAVSTRDSALQRCGKPRAATGETRPVPRPRKRAPPPGALAGHAAVGQTICWHWPLAVGNSPSRQEWTAMSMPYLIGVRADGGLLHTSSSQSGTVQLSSCGPL